MKVNLSPLKNRPGFNNAMHWVKLVSITGSAQIIIQAMGLVSGILILRFLSIQEYALYTIANTVLSTMTVLSDGGISTAVLAQGGKVWKDKEKLGVVLSTGLFLRRKFAVVSLIIMVPLLSFLLLHHGAGIYSTAFIVLAIIPTFYAALSDSLLEVIPKLHQDIQPLQKNQITVSIGRLIISSISLFFFPFTFIALLAAGIPRILGNIKLRKISDKFIVKSNEVDPLVKKNVLSVLKRGLPNAVYYSLSGPITIWLLSLFGTNKAIAECGALNRLGVVLGIISILVVTLITPRYARLIPEKKLLLKRFFQVIIVISAICGIIQFFVVLFSHQLLLVLGQKYLGLDRELILLFICSSLNVIIGTCFGLYSSRGWMIRPSFSISYNILVLITGILIFDLTMLMNVLWLNFFIAIMQLLMHFFFALLKINKLTAVN